MNEKEQQLDLILTKIVKEISITATMLDKAFRVKFLVFIQCVPKCPSLQILHRITVGVNDITDTPVALNGPRFFEPQLGKALAVAGVCGRVFFRTYADRIFYGFGYLDGSVFVAVPIPSE